MAEVVTRHRTTFFLLSFCFVVLAYGSGLHTFILTGESILVFARLLQDATSDWESETGNSKLETWSAAKAPHCLSAYCHAFSRLCGQDCPRSQAATKGQTSLSIADRNVCATLTQLHGTEES